MLAQPPTATSAFPSILPLASPAGSQPREPPRLLSFTYRDWPKTKIQAAPTVRNEHRELVGVLPFKTAMRKQRVPKYWTDRIIGHGKDTSDSFGGGPEELPERAEYVSLMK